VLWQHICPWCVCVLHCLVQYTRDVKFYSLTKVQFHPKTKEDVVKETRQEILVINQLDAQIIVL